MDEQDETIHRKHTMCFTFAEPDTIADSFKRASSTLAEIDVRLRDDVFISALSSTVAGNLPRRTS